jgi:hypothetical protein
MVAAPDEEKNLFSLRVNGGPDRNTMTPQRALPGWYNIRSPALSFLFMLARPGTQRDRSLMRPVTAPCSHDPP